MASPSFTLDEYGEYLEIAKSSGYRFCGFHEPAADDELVIYLRHDIDFTPRFIPPMADIEAQAGVRATYCVQLACPWYDLEAAESRLAVRYALQRGHWLGLHFDATAIGSDGEIRERVGADAARLAIAFSTEIRTVSFHEPGTRGVDHLELPAPLISTYGRPFFKDIGYVSDSNQRWRGKDLRQLLAGREHPRLQLLVHPFWWRTDPSTVGYKLRALAAELEVPVEELAGPVNMAIIRAEDG